MKQLFSSPCATLALISLLLFVPGPISASRVSSASSSNLNKTSSINFLAIGDWGGVGSYVLGFISMDLFRRIEQEKVAVGLAEVAKKQGAEFVMGLGDNFYMSGVGGRHPFDRIERTFEDVYSDPALQIPFYSCAGNHDHYGDVTKQVDYTEYSRHKAKTNSSFVHRWEFPDLYHKQTVQRGDLTIDMVFIDTVILEDAYQKHGSEKWVWGFSKLKLMDGVTHWKWLETTLQESTADYLLVAGHYPVFSQGSHGPTLNLVDNLRPLLDKYGAHYLAGHDHAMMHFTTSGTTSATNYIVTGAGNSCCSWRRSRHKKSHERNHPYVPLKWHMFYQDNFKGSVKGGFVSMQATLAAEKTG